MSKERLERIEHSAERTALLTKPPQPLVTISDSDFEWLIERAERVQELEEIKSEAIKQIDVTQRRNKRLEERVRELEENLEHGAKVAVETARILHQTQEQNKRYREALEFINEELELVLHSNKGLAEKMFYIENSKRKITEVLEGESNE